MGLYGISAECKCVCSSPVGSGCISRRLHLHSQPLSSLTRRAKALLTLAVFGRSGMGNSSIILSRTSSGHLPMNCAGAFGRGSCFEDLRTDAKRFER